MTHIGVLIPELSIFQNESNNVCASISQRRAAASIASAKGLKPNHSSDQSNCFSAEYLQNRPSIFVHNAKKQSRSMHFYTRVKPRPNDYSTEKDDHRPDFSNNDYSTANINDYSTANINGMPGLYTGDKTNLRMSAVGDGRRRVGSSGPKLENHTDKVLQGYESQYSRLRLGKNLLNFFRVWHRFTRSGSHTSKLDEFEGLMNVGTILLKEGEQGLDGRLDVGIADHMLKEAAVRFAAALAINPLSVAAAETWGITLLAHGKLKLLLSEKLRDMLLEARIAHKKSDHQSTVATLEDMIPKVCEECEILLVEAGRKFGKTVSMDKSNDFALYNWGLVLFYRARLIATDGLKDAVKDADEVYLASIEKFKATIQLSKDYSGAACLGWGLALRDRYWLHASLGQKDEQLLEQAKWASEQALHAYPNGVEAKLVVQACMEELEQFQSH